MQLEKGEMGVYLGSSFQKSLLSANPLIQKDKCPINLESSKCQYQLWHYCITTMTSPVDIKVQWDPKISKDVRDALIVKI